MILPSNSIEGADNPFEIRVYPGLFSQAAFPVVLLTLFSSLSIFFLADQATPRRIAVSDYSILRPTNFETWAASMWALLCLVVYRVKLFERNENIRLKFAQVISFLFRIPVVGNVEYTLYRSKLSIAEAERVKAPTAIVEPIALLIEDRSFYYHRGVSFRGMVRAIIHRVTKGKRSGASTITQQCARTVFLKKMSPAWRRKPVEIALSLWLESRMSKKEIMKVYLASARFERGVFGLTAAIKHFHMSESDFSRAEAFFLVERLGNINSQFIPNRVQYLLTRLKREAAISNEDIERIGQIYTNAISEGRIKTPVGRSPCEVVAFVLES